MSTLRLHDFIEFSEYDGLGIGLLFIACHNEHVEI
jgi:hypothetical protein